MDPEMEPGRFEIQRFLYLLLISGCRRPRLGTARNGRVKPGEGEMSRKRTGHFGTGEETEPKQRKPSQAVAE